MGPVALAYFTVMTACWPDRLRPMQTEDAFFFLPVAAPEDP